MRVRPYIEKYDADIEQNAENAIRLGSEPNSIVYGAKGFSFHRVFTSEVHTYIIPSHTSWLTLLGVVQRYGWVAVTVLSPLSC